MVKLYLLLVVTAFLAACGANVSRSEVKEYRVALSGGDVSFAPTLKRLVEHYNESAGIAALQFVESSDQANSQIYLIEGLEQRDGKVGWGQWFSETERSGVDLPGSTINKTTTYSFRVEFDAGFFRANNEMINGLPSIELRKLFAHEIGHGFQMDHASEASDVMFFDVTGDKDFTNYWPRVRAHFEN
jgi:hypothetical protein